MKKFTSLFLLTSSCIIAYSQQCLIDQTFGEQGRSTMPSGTHASKNIVVQPDGKVLQVASIYTSFQYSFAIKRFHVNGQTDSSFGFNGISIPQYYYAMDPGAMDLQPDGKIVIAGTSNQSGNFDFTVIRLNANGIIDSSFGLNGKVITGIGPDNDYARGLHIQADGKILVTGAVYRPDASNCTNTFYSENAVIRYKANGTVDSSFAQNGKLTYRVSQYADVASAVTTQQDGKILVVGTAFYDCYCDYYYGGYYCNSGFLVSKRFTESGLLDISYGNNGEARDSAYVRYPSSIALQPDGKLIITGAGLSENFMAVRFLPNGNLDPGFGNSGRVMTHLGGTYASGYSSVVSLYPDGRILLAGTISEDGNSSFGLARFKSDGKPDSNFNRSGTAIVHIGGNESQWLTGVANQGSKIIAGGSFYNMESYAAVIRILDSTSTLGASISPAGAILICEGTPLKLSTQSTGNLQWLRNGLPIPFANDTVLHVSVSGTYTVMVNNSQGCGISNPAYVTLIPAPVVPMVIAKGNVTHFCDGGSVELSTAATESLQWYESNNLIPGATSNKYKATSPGSYRVTASNPNGCSRTSDAVVVTKISGIPKPSLNWNGINFSTDLVYAFYQWYHNNTVLTNDTFPHYSPPSGKIGWYKVKVTDYGNCSSFSDSIQIAITAVNDIIVDGSRLRYYPNPVTTRLQLELNETGAKKFTAQLADINGRVVRTANLRRGNNEIVVTGLPAGVYSLVIRNEKERVALKIIVGNH